MQQEETIANSRKMRKSVLNHDADPFRLGLASGLDETRIDTLRQTAYATAGHFSISDPSLIVRKTDPVESLCLIVANKTTVAATVRLVFASARARAEKVLQGPAPLENSLFPTLTLCRGATHPDYRGHGLMTFLVGVGVAVAREASVPSVTGMQADGTPHYHGMITSGWQSRNVSTDAVQCIRIDGPKMKLVYIPKDRYGISENYAHEQFDQYRRQLATAHVIRQCAGRVIKMADG